MWMRLAAAWVRASTPVVTLIAAGLMLGFMIVVLPAEADRLAAATGAVGSPDTSLWYSPDDLYAMAEAYGQEGRAYYIHSRYTFDLAWPLVYTAFLVTAIGRCLAAVGARRLRLLVLLPLLGMLLDFAENTAAAVVMYRFPAPSPLLAALAPVFTFAKWLAIAAAFIVLIASIAWYIRYARVRWRNRQDRRSR